MALENITDLVNPLNDNFLNSLPPELLAPFAKLIAIIQVVGIVIIVYLVFLLIRGILAWKRNKRIDITYEKVLGIDRKLDELLKRTPRKIKIIGAKEKKPGFFSRLFGLGKKEKKK